jgi:hypothetical protein
VGIQCVRLKKGSHVDYAMLTEPGNEVIQAYLVNSIPASGKVIDPMTLLGIREKLEIVLKEE